jgi:membrane protein YfhO
LVAASAAHDAHKRLNINTDAMKYNDVLSRQRLSEAVFSYIISPIFVTKKRIIGSLQSRRVSIFIFAILTLFFTLLFRNVLFGGKFLIIGDAQVLHYPLRKLAWDMIRDGALPIWTPLIFSGHPLMSMGQLALGYPVTWPYLFLPGYWAEQIFILFPFLMSAIFTYVYLRGIDRSHVASLIGGLVYGYSGFILSPVGFIGSHMNSALWLPLVLLGIARSRSRPFFRCVLLSTVAYTMSILAGTAQVFVYMGMLALIYGLFLALFPHDDDGSGSASRSAREVLRPIAVALLSMVLAAGLSAFQLLESFTAMKHSVRGNYLYEHAVDGSFTPRFALISLFQPLFNSMDTSTYVPLLALGLAILAVFHATLRSRFRAQIFFWAIVAGMAWVLILGKHTPIFRLYFGLPFVSRFRYPSRHTIEWTFAIGVLAGYGWDILSNVITKVRETDIANPLRQDRFKIVLGSVLLLLGVGTGFYWLKYAGTILPELPIGTGELHYYYLVWKGAFTLIIIVALITFLRMINNWLQMGLLVVTIALYCFIEPYLYIIKPIESVLVAANRFETFGDSTWFLKQRLGEYRRDFNVMNPLAVSPLPERDSDTVNGTALAGIQNINGFDPLMMNRYNRALHSLPLDVVNSDPVITPDPALLSLKSHVLDLLNAQFVTSYSYLSPHSNSPTEKFGVVFNSNDLVMDSKRNESFSLDGGEALADTLSLVTVMGNSVSIENNTPVAKILIHCTDGQVIEKYFQAGVHTSEWSYDHSFHKSKMRHSLATIFSSSPGDHLNSFPAHRYYARIELNKRARVERIDIKNLIESVGVAFYKATLHDSVTGVSTPLPEPSPSRWRKVYDRNGVTVLENLRSLPRAWLTPEAEAVDQVESLRRIRGESYFSFDPKKTALVEIEPNKLPALTNDPLSEDSYARILAYEPSRLVIETNSNKQAMLVVSEMHYPGWVATLDGAKTPIHQTNFLLRGVLVPAGKHNVEMSYKAPGARNGAIISLLTAIIIGVAIIRENRRLNSLRTS